MSENRMDVPSFLRALSIGAVFTHGKPNLQPDSWVKIGEDLYRRTYDWVQFRASNFSSWEHVELTDPVPYSISQAEADWREVEERKKHSDRGGTGSFAEALAQDVAGQEHEAQKKDQAKRRASKSS